MLLLFSDEPSPGPGPDPFQGDPAQGEEGGGLIGLQSLEQDLGGGGRHQPPGGTLPPLDMSEQNNKVQSSHGHRSILY